MAEETDNTPPKGLNPYERAMHATTRYQLALKQAIVAQGGNIDAGGMFLQVNTLILETTALRELVFDVASTKPDGSPDNDMRMQLVVGYLGRLTAILEGTVAQMSQPKILVPRSN